MLTEPQWIFPFEGMLVGDSFFIPTLRPTSMIHAIEMGAKRAEVKVRTYVTTKEGCLGIRAWRIA